MGMIQEFQQADAERRQEVATLKREVAGMLKGFDEARAAMSKELRADLAKGDAQRKGDVCTMLKGFDEAHAAMSKELKADLAKGSAQRHAEVWGVAARRKGWIPAAPPPPVEKIPEEELIARAEPVEVTPEAVALRDRVFEYLANHPDGAKLRDLEEEFGVARIQMVRVLRNLMDENKVEKRELFYFAI